MFLLKIVPIKTFYTVFNCITLGLSESYNLNKVIIQPWERQIDPAGSVPVCDNQ